MTPFSIDTNIVIAVSNDYDNLRPNSLQLLKLREKDELFLMFTVGEEAIETFFRKFKVASDAIFFLMQKTKNSSNFPKVFEENLNKMMKKEKNVANFYKYAYSLIKDYIEGKNFKKIANIFKNHLAGVGLLILKNLRDLKEYKIIEHGDIKEDMIKIAGNVDSITSSIAFPIIRRNKRRSKKSEERDREHFCLLCGYIGSDLLDYITGDEEYYLWMKECLQHTKNDKSFDDLGIYPYLLRDYIRNT